MDTTTKRKVKGYMIMTVGEAKRLGLYGDDGTITESVINGVTVKFENHIFKTRADSDKFEETLEIIGDDIVAAIDV